MKSRVLKKLVNLFISRPEAEFHVRELERVTGEPVSSIQRQLAVLEREKFLKFRKIGSLKCYSLNRQYSYLPEFEKIFLGDQRKKELEKNLQKALRVLKKDYHANKVILFGSLARGCVSGDSDIDLLIIKEDIPPRYWDRVKEVAPLFADLTVGVDYSIWMPRELEENLRVNAFLREEILKNGKVLYDRAAR